MKTKRLHLYKITKMEAKEAFDILKESGPIIARPERLLEIKTGKSRHPIGQGFRNDIKMIIAAAK